MLLQKTVYDKLVAKVNSIDTSGFVLKTKYDTDKSELENKIPDTSGFVKKTDYDGKTSEIKGKIPDVTNLVTKPALTTVEIKHLMLVIWLKKQIMTQNDTKVTKLKINLITIIMIDILLLQNSTL